MKLSDALGSRVAIALIPTISIIWYAIGSSIELYVFLISVAALTFSQIILRDSAKDTQALQAKLDEILKAIPTASNDLIGIENDGNRSK